MAYGYSMEAFFAWYSGDKYESFMYWNRVTGPYCVYLLAVDPLQHRHPAGLVVAKGPAQHRFWSGLSPSLSISACGWSGSKLLSPACTATFCLLPGAYMFRLKWDWATYAGTLGFFMLLIFLFVRALPSISIFEVREASASR